MPRTALSLQHFFIPLLACTAVLLIGSLQWGSGFRTLLGIAQEDSAASIELSGVSSPKLDLEVVSWVGGRSLTLTLAGERTKYEARLTVPAEWKLQEVRGIHIRDIARYTSELQRTTFLFSMKTEITMHFTTPSSFDAIAFTHDTDSFTRRSALRLRSTQAPREGGPALFSLTHITLPEKEITKRVQIIEGSGLLTL